MSKTVTIQTDHKDNEETCPNYLTVLMFINEQTGNFLSNISQKTSYNQLWWCAHKTLYSLDNNRMIGFALQSVFNVWCDNNPRTGQQ